MSAIILAEIAGRAAMDPLINSSLRFRDARGYVANGREIPEQLLPGRFIERRCSAEERAVLAKLRSEDAVIIDRHFYALCGGDSPDWKPERVGRGRPSTFCAGNVERAAK